MRRAFKNTFRFAVDSVKSFDRYPKLISFTFKGESEFKTVIGGVISICTFVILVLYAYLMFSIMVGMEVCAIIIGKSNTSKNITTSVTNLNGDSDIVSLKGSKFMIGFTISSDVIDLSKDETYIGFSGSMYSKSGNSLTKSKITFSNCTSNDFPTISSTLISKMSLTSYYCAQIDNLSVLGNKFSDSRNYFELVFTRCSGTDSKGNTCKTTSQINNALNDAALAIAVVNSYFDFDDYNSPIKTYLDDQFYYYFLPGYEKETDVYIQQNSAEQLDSYFRYSPDGSQSNFIAIENIKEKIKVESSTTKQVMSIRFFKDSITRSYSRQVFSLLDVFGNIGGVNEILEIAGAIIVGLFSGKIFLFNILSSIYQVDSTHIEITLNFLI